LVPGRAWLNASNLGLLSANFLGGKWGEFDKGSDKVSDKDVGALAHRKKGLIEVEGWIVKIILLNLYSKVC
jgi:hypothetical protein